MVGTWIGDYYVQKTLGKGGMGEVYLAYDQNLRRHVAIKAVHPELLVDPVKAARFKDEAILQSKLQHPNVATVFAWLEEKGRSYIVMEFVQGETLDGLVRRVGVLPLGNAVRLFVQVLRGFGYAHSHGVVHRDIKPSNLMVDHLGVVKIMDFGIARDQSGERLTQTGKTVGTPEYMSPEQVLGKPVDSRADIYSLGILLYELITGDLPFNETSPFETMNAQLYTAPPDLSQLRPDVPDAVRSSIARALSKGPDDRFQKAEEWLGEIESLDKALPVEDFAKTAGPVTEVEMDSLTKSASTVVKTSLGTTEPLTAAPANRWLIPVLGVVAVLAIAAVGISMANRPSEEPRQQIKGPDKPVTVDIAAAISRVEAAQKRDAQALDDFFTLTGQSKHAEAKAAIGELESIIVIAEAEANKIHSTNEGYYELWTGVAEHYRFLILWFRDDKKAQARAAFDACLDSLERAWSLGHKDRLDDAKLRDSSKDQILVEKDAFDITFKSPHHPLLDKLVREVKE